MKIKWDQAAVAFLSGLLLGGALFSPRIRHRIRHMCDKAPAEERMLNRFSSRLNLSSEQKAQVRQIFNGKKVKMDAIFSEARPKFDQIRFETREEIRKVLSPEQLMKYDELDAKMRERFNKKFYRRL